MRYVFCAVLGVGIGICFGMLGWAILGGLGYPNIGVGFVVLTAAGWACLCCWMLYSTEQDDERKIREIKENMRRIAPSMQCDED